MVMLPLIEAVINITWKNLHFLITWIQLLHISMNRIHSRGLRCSSKSHRKHLIWRQLVHIVHQFFWCFLFFYSCSLYNFFPEDVWLLNKDCFSSIFRIIELKNAFWVSTNWIIHFGIMWRRNNGQPTVTFDTNWNRIKRGHNYPRGTPNQSDVHECGTRAWSDSMRTGWHLPHFTGGRWEQVPAEVGWYRKYPKMILVFYGAFFSIGYNSVRLFGGYSRCHV